MSSYGDDLFAKDIVASNDVKCNKVEATEVKATGDSGEVKCAKLGVGDKRGNPGAPENPFAIAAANPAGSGNADKKYDVPNDIAATGTVTVAAFNENRKILRGLVDELHKTGVLKSAA